MSHNSAIAEIYDIFLYPHYPHLLTCRERKSNISILKNNIKNIWKILKIK